MAEKDRKKPLVTVITLCYNHEKFLHDYMEGILMQRTNFPFRVIITDDKSTDSSASIIKEYADKYPNIFYPHFFEENQFSKGRSIVKDYCIPELQKFPTKYIAFCEADDFWIYPDKLQRQVDFLESHPKYSACYHHYKTIDAQGNLLQNQPIFNLRHSRKLSIYDMLIERQFQLASTLMRSDIILKDEELFNYLGTSHYSDFALFLASIHGGKVYCFKEYWNCYRIHSGGISNKDSEKENAERHVNVLKRMSSLYNGKYGRFDKQWLNHIQMRDALAEATLLRRERRFIAYSIKMINIFFKDPSEFVKTYYKQWQ